MEALAERPVRETSSLVFFNQAGGRLVREVVAAASVEWDVTYCTGEDAPVGGKVTVVRTAKHTNVTAPRRLWAWFRFLITGLRVGLFWGGARRLVVTTNPPVAPLLALVCSWLRGRRFTLVFFDIFPDALVRVGATATGSVIARAWRGMNRMAMRRADASITISHDMAGSLLDQFGGLPRDTIRMEVIPTWVDSRFITPIPKGENAFARENGLVDRLTVLYSGHLGAVHDISLLPAVAERFLQDERVRFVVVGEGSGRSALQDDCRRRGLVNMLFLPMQPESRLSEVLAAGDVGVVALAPAGLGVSMPSKTYYVMSAGSALLGISPERSELATLIRRFACGVNVDPEDVEGATEFISRALSDPGWRTALGVHSRQAAVEFFDTSVCIPRFLRVLRTGHL